MNSGYAGTPNYLDHIRRKSGIDECKNYFSEFGKEHREDVIRLMNDRRLYFASLFTLQSEIKEFHINEELSERNRIALDFCKKISDEKNISDASDITIPLSSEPVHQTLLWMLNTGAADDGLCNEFDQILDIAASVLIKTHHEWSVLPVIADLVFQRNRKGTYYHDLIWAFFQTRDVYALRFIAKYLRSPLSKDIQLARKLLNLPQDERLIMGLNRQQEYQKYLSWLKENASYLYFTGESLQFSNNPVPCNLNLEAKYLCKNTSPRSSKPVDSFTEEEVVYLNNFNQMKQEEKITLANYSQTLHKRNNCDWNNWIHYPVEKQIHIAQYGRRELV
jgi:hypothetical protein